MSHTTTISQVPIKDSNALREAAKDLQKEGVPCTLVENAKPRMYYSHQEEKCDFVLKLEKASYDIGFRKNPDGSYSPFTDLFGGSVAAQLCAKKMPPPKNTQEQHQHAIGRLMAHYSKHATINTGKKAGLALKQCKENKQGGYDIVFDDGKTTVKAGGGY